MDIKQSPATKAFISHNGKILILRESSEYKEGTNSGRYDVPGGRIEPGQKWEESLLREVKEETGLDVEIGKAFHLGEWRPEIKGEKCQIIGTFLECFSKSDMVTLSEDHDMAEWINPREYSLYNLIPGLGKAFEDYLFLIDRK